MVKALRAPSELVVACSSGMSNFSTVLSDSPNLFRISEAVFPRASKTWFSSLAVLQRAASSRLVPVFAASV